MARGIKRIAMWICLLVLLPASVACTDGRTIGIARAQPAGADASRVASADTTPVFRRLWEGTEPDFWSATVSPDGRYMSEVDWMTGDLAVLDLLDGELRRLTDKGPWDQVVAWAETSAFSPDGQRLAYTYWSDERWGYEIRVIDTDGSNETIVMPHPDSLYWIHVHDWTPDGKRLLATLYWVPERVEMALVDVHTGDIQVFETVLGERMERAELSPDGRFAAFDLIVGNGKDTRRDIFLAAVDGSVESEIVTSPHNDRFMGWAPDGGSILFYSDRELSEGIWQQTVRNGTPAGSARLVRSDMWQLSPIGFTPDGRYYYGVTTQRFQVHTASIDMEGGRLLTTPAPVSDQMDVSSMNASWSPDGQYLAYVLRAEARVSPSRIVVRPISGGDAREIEMPLKNMRSLTWMPDSRSILLMGVEAASRFQHGIYEYDLESGKLTTVAQPAEMPEGMLQSSTSADAKTFYRSDWDPETGVSTLYAWDLATREDRKLGTTPGLTWNPMPSPDNGTLAFVQSDPATGENRLMTIPTAGGSPRTVDVTGGYEQLGSLGNTQWSPEGRFLLVTGWDEEAETVALWRIPSAGGAPLKIAERPDAWGFFRGLRLNATGDRIAFTSGELRGEVWVMEDLPGIGGRLQARARP
jgi:Tol biopolymer transport system component